MLIVPAGTLLHGELPRCPIRYSLILGRESPAEPEMLLAFDVYNNGAFDIAPGAYTEAAWSQLWRAQ